MADSLLRMGCRIVEEDEAIAIQHLCRHRRQLHEKAARKAARKRGSPSVVATGCVASLCDELACLSLTRCGRSQATKLQLGYSGKLGFAPESASDDGLVISKPTLADHAPWY